MASPFGIWLVFERSILIHHITVLLFQSCDLIYTKTIVCTSSRITKEIEKINLNETRTQIIVEDSSDSKHEWLLGHKRACKYIFFFVPERKLQRDDPPNKAEQNKPNIGDILNC